MSIRGASGLAAAQCSVIHGAHEQTHQPSGDGTYELLEFAPEDAGKVEATKAASLMAKARVEWDKADHLYHWLWNHATCALSLTARRD
jgi:hypothetical protein